MYLLQCFVVGALNFGQLSIGLGIGYSAILIPQLERGPDVDTEVRIEVGLTETSWIVSLVSVGQVGGAVLGALLASAIGRKGGTEYWTVMPIWLLFRAANEPPGKCPQSQRPLLGLSMG